MRALLPSNPHVGFTPANIPVSLISLGTADLVASARELTPQDVVRPYRTRAPRRAAERPTAQAADFVVRAEFYRELVFPEASRRAGAPRCAALATLFSQPCAAPRRADERAVPHRRDG